MTELVRLIGTTMPTIVQWVGAAQTAGRADAQGLKTVTDLIAYCARVSNPKNQDNTDTAEKLLAYCIKHKHWSPFEMVNVVMEINTVS